MRGHPGCTASLAQPTDNNRIYPYSQVEGDVPWTLQYGAVNYGTQKYKIDYNCNGTVGEKTFHIQKEAGFVCPSGSGWSKLDDPNRTTETMT